MSSTNEIKCRDLVDGFQQQLNVRSHKSKSFHVKRHFVLHNYHDHSKDTLQDHVTSLSKHGLESHADSNVSVEGADANTADKTDGRHGSVAISFPMKLHVMLSKAEEGGFENIVAW